MLYYTYFIKWSDTGMQYYGARRCEGLPENDLWVKYFTSSKYVKLYRKEFGEPDVIEIRKVFTEKDKAFDWEKRVLVRTKSKRSEFWLNRCDINYNGAYGPKNHGKKVGDALRGIPKSKSHRESIAKSASGYKWVNNGSVNKQIKLGKVEDFLTNNLQFKIGMIPVSNETRLLMSKIRKQLLACGKIVMPSATGITPWNKGLTKDTSEKLSEISIKISDAKRGVKASKPVWNTGKTYNHKNPSKIQKKWITNGIVNMRINKDEFEFPKGFYLGRTTGWNTSGKIISNGL